MVFATFWSSFEGGRGEEGEGEEGFEGGCEVLKLIVQDLKGF